MSKGYKQLLNKSRIYLILYNKGNIPSYTTGIWCFAFCSKKYNPLKDFQIIKYEKFNFKSRYYNAAIHQTSFALPNFLQNEI